ncbi:PQQ-dependent sugar dehydrogenase [Jannaschia seohaensis]|uniref:Glucose/arabinose dehydrogenase n=1 Tax=Jannaschia seohaensis TaxID=475081 RepID=A0A2Y9AAD5_9RHOB|nr:PQQ-dependent sugar dehydrogenase [Jannaschia seohaensis]PWJ21121.1 glucose/arabinose dehydrogenase [Jannaschia seohaensis]SSA41531.1 Glucose/arabinose dehydrogenase, beta-propeller fold [Jannaschia seohaensis]
MRFVTFMALLVPAAACAQTFTWGTRNTDFEPAFPEQFRAELVSSGVSLSREVLADGLVHPWGIATLPDGAGWLVTERPGRLRHLSSDGTLSDPIAGTPDVVARRQGGLLDVVLAPDFAETRTIVVTYAKPVDGGSATAAARMILSDDLSAVSEVEDIFVQTPPSANPMHFGSRAVFLPDGTLAITTGEHFSDEERPFAQDLDKTYGKVIRVTLDGAAPSDNPFVGDADAIDTIWSYGHRNIQGAAVDADGTFWTIEHGPAGGDELNRPEAGANYGWPLVSYGKRYGFSGGGAIGSGQASMEGVEEPVYFWDPVIAPGGMAFHSGASFREWNGDILASSLNPGGVVRLELEDGLVVAEERLLRDLGRVRDVEVQPDGSFIVLTDFQDGSVFHITPANPS